MFIFIAGMTRSGKSAYAERRLLDLAEKRASESEKHYQKIYVAAAEIHDDDPEMLARVESHKARRKGMGFTTIERYRDLGGLELPEKACVLIESLTVWTANEMFRGGNVNHNAGGKVYTDFMSIYSRAKDIVVVSDDIFSDGITYDSLTEEYMRILGGLHVKLAALADEVIEVVSGLPVFYKHS